MDLAKLTVVARPRTAWEGVDLGFALAREWFLPLWGLWWLGALPVNLLLLLLLPWDKFWLVLLLGWWLKPLYEPPLLFWLSRALFGERLSLRALLRQWPAMVRPRLFANLTWARLSPSRSFHMPVALLEGLGGKARQERIAVLGRRQQTGFWLTYMGIHFEVVLELSAIVLLMMMLPEELQWLDWEGLFLDPGGREQWLQYAADLLAMSLIAPFYVAGGFGLYISRRIELEAWDIEIAFRRMQARRNERARGSFKGAAVVLLALGLVSGAVPEARAQQLSAPEAQQIIEEVLANETFGKRETESYWEYVGETEKEVEFSLDFLIELFAGFFKGTARVAEVLMWVGGALALVYLAYRIAQNRHWLRPGLAAPQKRQGAPPAELFGLDLRPQSLPADLVGEALALLQRGRQREALSLLYRGALARLVNAPGMEIPAGATEGECLRLVRVGRPEGEAEFFQRLTRSWLRMAYGHLPLAAGQVETLCREWGSIYGQG